MIGSKKINTKAMEYQLVQTMTSMLKDIYSNRSSDEYKSHGDITASPVYRDLETMLADLNTLKGFHKHWIPDIKNLFNTLHRPVFKKLVTEYISNPTERNTVFTAMYTVGYRVLVGELSRIYASSEATDKGITYKPDKISKKSSMIKFISIFNTSLEQKIDNYIKSAEHDSDSYQEGAVDAVVGVVKTVAKGIPVITSTIQNIFHTATELNPISLINTILSRSYDKKVEKFNEVAAMYQATKEAYDDYMKIPAANRKEKIESNYQKLLEKYNIKMNNLKATIDHYDQRSIEEAEKRNSEEANNASSTKTNTSSDNNTSDDNENNDGFSF